MVNAVGLNRSKKIPVHSMLPELASVFVDYLARNIIITVVTFNSNTYTFSNLK